MRISDLDMETKRVIFAARRVSQDPTEANIDRLQRFVNDWDCKHEEERNRNLVNALWGPNGIMHEAEVGG